MLRSLLAILVVLLLGAGAAGAYWKFVLQPDGGAATGPAGGGRGARGPVPVEAAAVRVGPVEITTEAVGTLSSNEAVVLRPEVTGRVAAINFEEGRPVAAGQVLIELDASVEKAQLAEAEAQMQLATANLERARELRRSGAGTQRALDEAQAQQRTAQASVDLAKARLAKLSLEAPFDGLAGLRAVSVGDFVTAGTEIVNLEQIQPLKVDFRVPEIFLPTLFDASGERRIEIRVDALPRERFPGRIYALNPLVDAAGRAIVIRARVENPTDPASGELRLRPGLFARVTLTLSQEARALWIPEEAIIPQAGKQFVYKLVPGPEGQELAQLTEVQLGQRRTGEVQIAGGLVEGDRVITAGILRIRDKAPVEVREPPAEAEPGAPSPNVSGSPAPAQRTARGDQTLVRS